MLNRFAFSAVVLVVCAPAALALTPGQARTCQSLASELPALAERIQTQIANHEAVAADVEADGEAWETAEEQRLFSADHAATADAARARYDGLKQAFYASEDALLDRAQAYQADVNRFNTICASG